MANFMVSLFNFLLLLLEDDDPKCSRRGDINSAFPIPEKNCNH